MKNYNFDGFYIRNMSEYQYIRKHGINGKCIADYTVYGFNNISVKVLETEGFDEIVSPIELNEKEMMKHPYIRTELRHYKGTLTNIRPPDARPYYKNLTEAK